MGEHDIWSVESHALGCGQLERS